MIQTVVNATLLLPDLDREDSCFSISYAFVCAEQNLSHNTTTFSTCICTIIDRRKYNLITATRVDCVHIVNECLHCLMYSVYGLVDGMLLQALFTFQACQVFH